MKLIQKATLLCCLAACCLLHTAASAQAPNKAAAKKAAADEEAAYTRAITQRADKIVTPMNLSDTGKATRVRDLIAQQYRHLNEIHTWQEEQVKAAKDKAGTDKAAAEAQVKHLEAKARERLTRLHGKYLARLEAELTPAQVEQVKDGMTYGVVPITYNGYLAMLPNLTETQKSQIMTWLVEARELAMDAGSSEKKHATFGKYKGKINNYLSAAGYNMKQAGEDWQKRLKAEQAAKVK
jgi:Spy/CpxP family protein refolding chaperone